MNAREQARNVDVEAKIQEYEKAQARRQEWRAQRRLERKCFWTRPLGHYWKAIIDRGYGEYRCVGCNKENLG